MDKREPYVAVGLLTQRDLDRLGDGFRSAFPVPQGDAFDDLLRAIDASVERSKDPKATGRR